MPIAVSDAISPAFSRMAQICFKPFNIGKWFVMGFCAFLSTCGEGGGNPNFNGMGRSGSSSSSSPGPSSADISNFISTYLGMIILIAILGVILIIAITLICTYLRCRGRFMFLDNIMENRAAVREPWNRYGPQAMSYFWFSVVMMVVAFAAVLIIGGLTFLLVYPDIKAQTISSSTIITLLLAGLLLVPTFIILAVIQAYAYDFVVPIMMVRNSDFSTAWREAKTNVLRGNVGQLILFYLLKMVFALAGGIAGMIAICLTLCIGALPYLSSVLLLPILVFSRTFALSFLEQFHIDYRFSKDTPPPTGGFPVMTEPTSPFPS